MAWLSRNNFTPSDALHSDDLNNLANDQRAWGGDVNGGGHTLSNVVITGSQSPWTGNVNAAGFNLVSVGRIGIGTAAPSESLSVVNGAIRVFGTIASSVANSVALDFSAGYGRILSYGASPAASGGISLYTIRGDGSGAVAALTVTPTARVGIGTVSPNNFVSIVTNTPTTLATANQFAICEGTNNPGYQFALGYVLDAGVYKGVLQVTNNGVGSALLLNPSGGNVSIGSITAAYPFDVRGPGTANAQIHISYDASDAGCYLFVGSGGGITATCGGAMLAGTWTAKSTFASALGLGSASIGFYVNTGLTVGAGYAPTAVAAINPAGMQLFALAGAGVRALGVDATGQIVLAAGAGQSPWTGNINGGGFNLSNVATVTANSLALGGGAVITGAATIAAGTSAAINFRGDPASFGWPPGQTGVILQGVSANNAAEAPIIIRGTSLMLMSASVGVNTLTPVYTLDVVGIVRTSAGVILAGLPSSNPGAGSKQLWYDPADGNRVKFAA